MAQRLELRDRAREYESRWDAALDENTFQHFLAIEQKRAERSGRSALLLLVEFHSDHAQSTGVAPAVAARLFNALSGCTREVDFVGWYQANRIPAAVLAQRSNAVSNELCAVIAARVGKVIRDGLPAHLAGCLEVRVVQLHPGSNC